jgi:hypothetical protein
MWRIISSSVKQTTVTYARKHLLRWRALFFGSALAIAAPVAYAAVPPDENFAPSFQNSTPYLSNINANRASLTVRPNEAGTVFYVVLPDHSSEPSSAQVIAGQNDSGATAGSSVNITNIAAYASASVHTLAVNSAPTVANAIPNQNATEDAAFSFQFAVNTFNDIDAATTLVYSAQLAGGGPLPGWLSFNAATRTFSGTPLNANVGTVSIDVIASDGSGGTVTDTFDIVVANTNDAPTVANTIPNQNATEDAAFSFQFAANTFNDQDAGSSLTYSAQLAGGGALPAWLIFNDATRTFNGTPANGDVGTISVQVTANDGLGGTVSDTFDITVANTNDIPTVANQIPNQTATENTLFNFSFAINTFNDQDVGDTLTYSARLAGGTPLPGWLSFDSATRTFSGTPSNVDVGNITIEVVASDGGLSVSDFFDIVIGNVDDSPVLAIPIPNQNATEDVAFNFQFDVGTFTDPDVGDVLTYSAEMADGSPLLPWLGFDPATRTFFGTPANGDVGTISIKVTAADINGGPVATDTFDIVIANTNDAPTIANAIPDQAATEDSAFNFTFAVNTFTDQDVGNTLSYTAQLAGGGLLPAWLSFDAGTRTFSGTPLNTHVGTVSIDVIASDGNGGLVTETFAIVVANTNDAPNVDNVIANQNATQGIAFNFQFAANTFSDVDGNTLTYSAQLVGGAALPAWLNFDSATRTFSGTPANGDVGTLSIDVTANDGNGGTATDAFDIVIANVNDTPTVVITQADYNAIEQVPINLHGTGISVADVDGDALTITLTGAGVNSNLAATVGTTGVVIVSGVNTNTLILSGTAAQLNDLFAGNNGSTLTYRLSGDTPVATRLLTISASDGSLSGNDTAIINIAAVNDGPENNVPVGVQITNEDTALVFSAGNGNQIQIDDLDAGNNDLEVTLSVTNGTLTLAGVAGLAFTTGDGTADSSLVFRGTQANINAALATLTFNPTANYNGNAQLTITTSDLGNTGTGGTLTDSDNINITITAANDAPTVANPIPNQNATEDSVFNFQFAVGAFADADADSLTYTVQLAGGGLLPAWLSFDAVTRTFSGTPANGDVGTVSIDVIADDGNGGTVTDTFNIVIANSNNVPTVANAIPNQNATENSVFNFQFAANTFNDIDVSNTLTYSVQLAGGGGLPAWLSFDALTRTFSGVPATPDTGTLNIDVIASDGNGGTVTDTFSITVSGLPDTEYIDTGIGGVFNPVSSANQVGQSFSYNSAGPTYTVNEISLYLARYDAAALQTITIELRDAWNGAVLASDSIPSSQISRDGFGWHSFNFSDVVLNDQQAYVIQISSTGTDDLVLVSRIAGNTYTDGVMIENGVPNASGWDLAFKIAKDDGNNTAPVLDNPITDQAIDAELPFNLVVPANTFSDPDPNDTITYRAQLAGGGSLDWLTFNEATKTFAGTPHWYQAGTITVELIATDNHGASTSEFFDIEVISTNVAPTVANPIPDQVANEDAPFSFQFDANTFADVDVGNTFTYLAELAVLGGLPPWLSFDVATRTFSGTPANGDVGTWTVDVTANDGFGGEIIDTFVITVANTNDVPTLANPIADQNATEDAAFNFQFAANTFTDVDVGDILTYTAQLAGGGAIPGWLGFDPVTRTFTGTPLDGDVGTVSIDVIADDGNGGTVTDTFNIVVGGVIVPPIVSSITVSGSPADTDVSMAFVVAFNRLANNISIDDFQLTKTGSADGAIASVSASSGSSVNVTVNSITGNGTLRLDLKPTTNITDALGNGNNTNGYVAAFTSGSIHTVAIPVAPDAPTIGAATAGDGQVSVAFSAPVNNGGSAITSYTVTSNPGGFINTGASSPIVIAGLTNGTAYTFTVTATNTAGTGAASAASATVTPNGAPTISGIPLTSIDQGDAYSFVPVAADPDEDALTFSIVNKPSWASFSVTTGELTGTPAASDVGETAGIVISVSDGIASAALTAFTLTVTAAVDPLAPVVTAPDALLLNATGLYTPVTLQQLLGLNPAVTQEEIDAALAVLATDSAEGNNCCTTRPGQFNTNNVLLLSPGRHEIVWTAINAEGLTGTDTQIVNLRPLVSFSKNQIAVPDSEVQIRVILNGPAPVYPLDIPFVIDEASSALPDEHNLVAGLASFTEPGQREVIIPVALRDVPGAGDSELIIRLDDQSPAGAPATGDLLDINAGVADRHIISIREGNMSPMVSLQLSQGGVITSLVTSMGGLVTATALVVDPNPEDSHSFDWSASDASLNDNDGVTNTTRVFDPAGLDGRQRLEVAVSDSAGASAVIQLYFRVVKESPILDPDVDSDGDGIDDLTEGFGDSNGNGIHDYLDNMPSDNVLPETIAVTGSYLLECEPGVLCRIGRFALMSDTGGVQILDDDIDQQSDLGEDEAYLPTGGIFDFEIQGLATPGQSVHVVLPQQAPIPAHAVYRKFQNGQWVNFVEDANNALHSAQGDPGYCPPPGSIDWQSGLIEGSLCVQLTIEDGGPNDADGEINAAVADLGAVSSLKPVIPPVEPPAEPPEQPAAPTVPVKSTGGGAMQGMWLLLLGGLLTLRHLQSARAVVLLLILVGGNSQAANPLLDQSYLRADLFEVRGVGCARG